MLAMWFESRACAPLFLSPSTAGSSRQLFRESVSRGCASFCWPRRQGGVLHFHRRTTTPALQQGRGASELRLSGASDHCGLEISWGRPLETSAGSAHSELRNVDEHSAELVTAHERAHVLPKFKKRGRLAGPFGHAASRAIFHLRVDKVYAHTHASI